VGSKELPQFHRSRLSPAAVVQHLVGGSAAFVVLVVDVGAVFDAKLDDLLAVLRVPCTLWQIRLPRTTGSDPQLTDQ
jgi:hypothetical protein